MNTDLTGTKFLLDSGDPDEYRAIARLTKDTKSQLWGSTTNPTLIAKKLAGEKISQKDAFRLQKEIVLEIIEIVPGAVSAEVYADEETTAGKMIKQGEEISTWHKRVVVKLPTTLEGFKARTTLREEKIPVNNTLVFSQPQIFAICLHEQIIQKLHGPDNNFWPPFISPFIGRLDDIGENGADLVNQGMRIKRLFKAPTAWMLAASIRTVEHIAKSIAAKSELITAPAKLYNEWFALSKKQQTSLINLSHANDLKAIPNWNPNDKLFNIDSTEKFMKVIQSNSLNIHHALTDKGLTRFAQDWKAIIK